MRGAGTVAVLAALTATLAGCGGGETHHATTSRDTPPAPLDDRTSAGGGWRIALIGASVGARAVLLAGADHPRRLAGVVALSTERRISRHPGDLLPIGRRVRVPVLTIGSRQDPLTAFGKDTLARHRTIPDDRAVIVSGGDHGVELLGDRHRRRLRSAILKFLRDTVGGGR